MHTRNVVLRTGLVLASASALALPAVASPVASQAAPRATVLNPLTSGESLLGAALTWLRPPAEGIPGPDSASSFDATLPNGRRVTPAGTSAQVGQDPLNSTLTDDGRFLLTSNDDERVGGTQRPVTAFAPLDAKNGADRALTQYSIAVTDTATMSLSAVLTVPTDATPHPGPTANGQTNSDRNKGLFLGLVGLSTGTGYTVYAAGGVADVVYKFFLNTAGQPLSATPQQIPIPVATDKTQATYGMAAPGWLTLSNDHKTLFVVNSNANTVVPIDLASDTPGTPIPVGYFPYAALQYGDKLFVSNEGLTTRTFADGEGATNATTGVVTHTGTAFIGGGTANVFGNPVTDPSRSSSVSVINLSGGPDGTVSLARPIDGLNIVGGTHPSALALAQRGRTAALYVADANEDRIAVVDPDTEQVIRKVALPVPAALPIVTDEQPFGLTPNALAVSPDQHRLYVAEAGLNSVAVYDVSRPTDPRFLGRIPTGWYPTGVTVSPDGAYLYVTNAKGAGSPYQFHGTFVAPGTYSNPDVNLMFGSAQQVPLTDMPLGEWTRQVDADAYRIQPPSLDTLQTLSVLQHQVKHVFFILRENKSYDTYFGADTVLNARGAAGAADYAQYGPYVPVTRALAETFAVGDNNYADAEESNAGHSFAMAAQSTAFMQKTNLQRGARPLTNIKNQDPEDYPLQGYVFNALARQQRSYRDYGDNIRISGYDDANSGRYCLDDPKLGCDPANYGSIFDTTSPTVGLGGLYSEKLPALQVLAGHLDGNYPGWNLRISDQRRAQEFIKDFGPLIDSGNAPAFTNIWLPDDHTGGCTGTVLGKSLACTPTAEVADSDAAVGQIMSFLSHSPIWSSSAVFITEDDAQSSPDHVYAHRTYTIVASPWAKRGAVVHTLGSTVSVPKTIEEILGLRPMSWNDLLAGDLLSYFTTTPDYTPFDPPTATSAAAQRSARAVPPETSRIWALADRLDTARYDADTARIGELTTLYFRSAHLAARRSSVVPAAYWRAQNGLYRAAQGIVGS